MSNESQVKQETPAPSIAPEVDGDQQRFDVKLPRENATVSNHVFTCSDCGRQWTIDSSNSLECFFIGLCYWCIRERHLSKDQIDQCLQSLGVVTSPAASTETKAKEIVEEYKQRVMQLPPGAAVPCAKWLETRLRIALDLAAPASTVAPPSVACYQTAARIVDLLDAWREKGSWESQWESKEEMTAHVGTMISRHSPAPASPAATQDEAESTQELLELARKVYVEVSGDDEGMQDIQTTAQACQVINGFLREVRARCRESAVPVTPPSTGTEAAAQEIIKYVGANISLLDASKMNAKKIERIIIEHCFSAGDE